MKVFRLWSRLFVLVCLGIVALLVVPSAATNAQSNDTVSGPIVGFSVQNDVTPPLREMPLIPSDDSKGGWRAPELMVSESFEGVVPIEDSVVDRTRRPFAMPSATRNFEGTPNVNGSYPPDTNGDVGLNHYVQMVNVSIQMWDKNGNSVYGPASTNTLWQGFGGACENRNDGDPVVLYDQMAQRWMISQFTTSNPFGECIAISTSPDPTGAYYRYFFQFSTTQLYDYPHFGIWPVEGNNTYVMAVNRFLNGAGQGASAIAFERDAMLVGQPARFVEFQPSGSVVFQPADLDGDTVPAPNSPNPLIALQASNTNLRLWKLKADWNTPSNSTFTGPTLIPVAGYTRLCNGVRGCMPQPDTAQGLDALGDRVLQRLAYRKFEGYETMVISHAVDVDNGSPILGGVRWYEIRNPLGTPTVHQQSTYSPDGTNRWMPSVAMDGAGNIGLVYSVGSGTVYPSIYYAGRLASDPLSTLGQGESVLIAGSGSQTGTAGRWGDYANISTDPIDDCTFWMTTEYMATTSTTGWRTRIGAFTFPGCQRLQADVANQTICQGQDAVVPITAHTGFGGVVTLSGSGNPNPSTLTFNQNPLQPPFPQSATVTFGNTGSAAPGIYNLVLKGTDGTVVDTALTQVTILGTPLAPTLSTPVQNAVLGSALPQFTWAPIAGATTYTIEIATDAAFASIVRSATVAGTSYTVSSALPLDSEYFWRVRATTPCGVSANAVTSRFILISGNTASYCRSGLTLAIPDGNTTGVTDTMTIPAVGTIGDVNVSTTLTHSWISDVVVKLTSPSNTALNVIQQPGVPGPDCDQNHIRALLDSSAATPVEGVCNASSAPNPPPYSIDGTYRPNYSLSVLNGQNPNGVWSLNISDRVGQDTGRLNEWCLHITSNTPTDFSDLTAGYGVAWHSGSGALRLGSAWSADDTMPLANGDDPSDDGVVLEEVGDWLPGGTSTATVMVTGGSGYLAGWFDWNQNGQMDHPSEKSVAMAVSAGVNSIPFTIPLDADLSEPVKARFRLYAAEPTFAMGSESPSGTASGGEVEDYGAFGPLAVEYTLFEAWRIEPGVQVRWETATEVDILGFNIWRGESDATPTTQLNSELILSESPGGGQGATYEWLDANASHTQPYFYWIESVDTVGHSQRYGPVAVQVPMPTAVEVSRWAIASPGSALPIVVGLLLAGLITRAWRVQKRR